MYSPATVAYCGLTSSRANGLRAGTDPTLLSHNGSSAPATRCTDRSSSGGNGEERGDYVVAPQTLAIGRESRSVARPTEMQMQRFDSRKKLGEAMLLPI